jgi:hypothetical protein
MTSERVPEEPHRATFDDDEARKPAVLDNKLQPAPGLPEAPASSGRIAIYTVGIAVVLGTVFYGLDSSSINYAGTTPTAENAVSASPTQNNAQPPQMTAQTSPPLAPPGMREVTPHPNTSSGVTTGANSAPTAQNAAPSRPRRATRNRRKRRHRLRR